jgi:predicted DNA-binding transcriptional regulator AlpA
MLDLVGVPEIADMLGASRRTAWRYIERDDFPEPVAQVTAKRLWKRRDVERWAKRTLPLTFDPRRRA